MEFEKIILDKKQTRTVDESTKPLKVYRQEELAKMHENFYGENMAYHFARYYFIHKASCMEPVSEESISKYARQKEEIF